MPGPGRRYCLRCCLEYEGQSEPVLQRQFRREALRQDHRAWRDVPVRSAERIGADAGDVVAAEVRPVRQVEELHDRLQLVPLAELKELADPQIELVERLAAQRIVADFTHGPGSES